MMLKMLLAGAAGAALAYFLDPQRGERRRTEVRELVMGLVGMAEGRDGSPGRLRSDMHEERQGGADETAEGDLVTEQSQMSFPASDPPSWQPAKVG